MTSHYHSHGLTHLRDQISHLHHHHWNNNRMSYSQEDRISSQGMVIIINTITTMYKVSMRLIITTLHIRMKNNIITENILRIKTFYKILHNVMIHKLFSLIINIHSILIVGFWIMVVIITLLSIIGMETILITITITM